MDLKISLKTKKNVILKKYLKMDFVEKKNPKFIEIKKIENNIIFISTRICQKLSRHLNHTRRDGTGRGSHLTSGSAPYLAF